MATFKYISKDMSAKTIRGTLEADDRNDLVRKLKEQNLFLVSCQDVTKKTVNQYKMKLNEYLILFELESIYNVITDNDKNGKNVDKLNKIGDLIYNKRKTNEDIAKLFK